MIDVMCPCTHIQFWVLFQLGHCILGFGRRWIQPLDMYLHLGCNTHVTLVDTWCSLSKICTKPVGYSYNTRVHAQCTVSRIWTKPLGSSYSSTWLHTSSCVPACIDVHSVMLRPTKRASMGLIFESGVMYFISDLVGHIQIHQDVFLDFQGLF